MKHPQKRVERGYCESVQSQTEHYPKFAPSHPILSLLYPVSNDQKKCRLKETQSIYVPFHVFQTMWTPYVLGTWTSEWNDEIKF